MGKVEKTRYGESWKNERNSSLAHPKWWHETEIVKFDPKAVFSLRPDGESCKNAFWKEFDDLRYPSVLRCLEKPTQNGGMKPKL